MLPKLETPVYQVKIPSTGKTVEFRPYLVKEEKILLIAQESNDPKEMIRTLKGLITACTFSKVDVDALTSFDLEYLFLKLRAKSVGETVTVKVKCPDDGEYNEVTINLETVEVVFPPRADNNIKLTDTVGVVLRYIPVGALDNLTSKSGGEMFGESIAASIDYIYDQEKIYKSSDTPREELMSFVDSLNLSQMEKIQAFMESYPRVEKKIDFICTKCKLQKSVTITGLQNFF